MVIRIPTLPGLLGLALALTFAAWCYYHWRANLGAAAGKLMRGYARWLHASFLLPEPFGSPAFWEAVAVIVSLALLAVAMLIWAAFFRALIGREPLLPTSLSLPVVRPLPPSSLTPAVLGLLVGLALLTLGVLHFREGAARWYAWLCDVRFPDDDARPPAGYRISRPLERRWRVGAAIVGAYVAALGVVGVWVGLVGVVGVIRWQR